jgi:hypothetical protein
MREVLFSVPAGVWLVVVAFVTWLSSKGVARLSRRAQDFKTKTDGSNAAGQLAVNVATRADTRLDKVEKRLDRIEAWRRRVLDEWWPAHHKHDETVRAELLKLDPDAVLVDPPSLPELRFEDDAV